MMVDGIIADTGVAESGMNPASKHQISSLGVKKEQAYAGRDGRTCLVRPKVLRREQREGKKCYPCSADYEENWESYLVDPYSSIFISYDHLHTYVHTNC